MSEAYAEGTSLVSAESNLYDRGLDSAIALAILSFFLGIVTLVKVVHLDATGPALTGYFTGLLAFVVGGIATVGVFSALGITPVTSERVRGIGFGLLGATIGLTVVAAAVPVSLATLLGGVVLLEALAVLAAGIVSWQGLVDTEPSSSPGLLAGAGFGMVGLFIGAGVGGPTLGGGLVTYLAAAGVVGLLFFVVTVLPREDLGTAIPAAFLVCLLGALIVTGTIDLGWTWSPGEDVDGSFTGQVVIPLMVLLGSVVSSWGAAKARAGYGARGRQYGSYLVIYLNALLMVVIMVSIVAFVAMKGLTYAFHDFTIGAVSGLVLLTPLLVLTIDYARTRAGTESWHSGARQLVRVLPLAVVGAIAGFLAFVQLRGQAFSVPFEYIIHENRTEKPLDTAASVITDPTVGTLLVILIGALLFWYFLRKYGSIRGVGTFDERVATLERGVGIGLGLVVVLVLLLAVPIPDLLGLPISDLQGILETLGLPLVYLSAGSGALLAVAALGTLAVGNVGVAERGYERAQVVRVGLFGGLGLLIGATLLEPTAKVNPGLGPADLVPMVAMVAATAALGVAVLTAVGARSAGSETTRVLHRETALGLATGVGFVVVAALHVALTGVPFSVGPLTIGYVGTLSWPMTMHAYIPLTPNPGGIMPAVVGTTWLVVGASLFAVPLGVGAAVFLTEYAEQGKFTALVEIATNSLWSTPSIVFGLFGAAFLIPRLGGDESLMSGMLVLGFMLLPLVLITSREAIKSVPDEYRDASAALGVSQWETIKSVVLPAAVPGVITGVILGVGRIAGETAPLILVLGSTLNATESIDVLGGFQFVSQPPFVSNPALLEASAALPTQVWAVIAAGVSGSPSMGWASALVLLMVVLSFYAIGITARTYFRRKLDHE